MLNVKQVRQTMKKCLVLLLPLLLLAACDSWLEQNPPSLYAPSDVFSSVAGVDAAVRGIYSAVKGESYYDNFYFSLVEVQTDYAFGRGSQQPPSQFDLDGLARERMGRFIWSPAYTSINRSNSVVANLQKAKIEGLNEEKRKRFVAEARILRALNYFNLVRLFGGPNGGGVPLRTKPTGPDNLHTPRASIDEVYTQIVEDLKFAEKYLPKSYTGDDRGRATKWAAKALLSKVYLTREKWAKAEAKADEIIDSGQFWLVVPDDTAAEFNKIFGPNAQAGVTNHEVIWEFTFVTPDDANRIGSYLHSGRAGYWPSGVYAWYANIDICRVEEAFEVPLDHPEDCGPPGGLAEKESFIGEWHEHREIDMRAQFTLYDPTREGDQRILSPELPMLFRKYRSPGVAAASNPIPLFRYAEILLIKSEAEFRQHGATEEAHRYLNMIRRRARGLNPNEPNPVADVSPTLAGSAFLDTLLLERAKEFVMEGKRYYDLIRTKKNGMIRGLWLAKKLGKGTPESKNFHWPIPRKEIRNNDSLSQADQNPGW